MGAGGSFASRAGLSHGGWLEVTLKERAPRSVAQPFECSAGSDG